jgi:microcin C transport system substrate-binding protein
MFQNRAVRHALALALDFDWMNQTLFYGQYTANDSFFANSELAAQGLPKPAELALLEPFRAQLPAEVFTEPVTALGKQYPDSRARLRAAKKLLNDAGWEVQNGVLTETASGQQMRFTVTLVQAGFQRIVEPYLDNLKKLGVQTSMQVVDDAVYERLWRTHDFDMVVASFGQSQSPGNEQRDYWHSETADAEGSRNIIGIKHPAVDALVEAIISAGTREDLLTATHALDRVLWHEHYVVPHWYIAVYRLTYWNKLSYPKTLPLYFSPMGHLMYCWIDPAKAQALEAALAANQPLKR